MQVRRPGGVTNRPYRLERVTAARIRRDDAVALEIVVARRAVVAGVVVAAVHVALPQLHARVDDRPSVARKPRPEK